MNEPVHIFVNPDLDKGDAITTAYLNAAVKCINRVSNGVPAPKQVRTGGVREPAQTFNPTREQFRRVEFIAPLKEWTKGEPITASKLNETVHAVNILIGAVPPPMQVRRDSCLPVVVNVRPIKPGKPTAPLTTWAKGDALTAVRLNAPGQALQRLEFGVRPPTQVKRDYFPCS